ncbi:sensor histidine kinase [Paenibacillus wynnii]|uniref:sensor histidine kinase n=1 Tax=Paenibacillus wynnii TaxID=268407 RepID=UPI00278D853E|nr:sensor histidine kinase [Paenibacillus wynnii]MDQ0194038.1 two-component system sensor histidine kinase YesM [Paenibacillus wynnii]
MQLLKRLQITEWFRNQLIRKKIMFIYMPVVIIPLCILGFVSYHVYTEAIVKKTVKSVSDNSTLIITLINGMLTNTESAANMLTLNLNKVIFEERFTKDGEISDLQLYTQITNQLSYALLVFPDVESAAFIDKNNVVYGSNLAMEAKAELVAGNRMLNKLEHTNGSNIWFAMERRNYLVTSTEQPVLTLGKRIVNINTGEQQGYLILNMRESTLSAIYRNIGSIQAGSFIISDSNGLVVSALETNKVLHPLPNGAMKDWVLGTEQPNVIQPSPEGKMLLVSTDIKKLGWKLISTVPYNRLTQDTTKITQLIIFIGFICSLFAILGAGVLSQWIAKPIISLSRQMKHVNEGNLDNQLEIASRDEIGILASGFNMMMQRIKELLLNISAEQRKKREYELALIHAQMKPHFLYNTLDVIYTLSEMGRARDVQRTTKALADFYRVALSNGRDQISLEDELSNVQDYLSIQRIRYSDVFDFTIDIQPEILSCIIPKLTLQPLVENAIYHGLKTKESFGELLILGWREGDKVILKVKDDGVGIAPERLQTLTTAIKDQENQVGYGLNSVHERIRLYFGEEYGLHITSILGLGTEVSIELPYQTS